MILCTVGAILSLPSLFHDTNTDLLFTRDRPILFPIFKHFTIIGYWLKKKIIYIFFLLVTYTIIQSITSSEMCSLYLTHPSTHTPGAVDTHTHTHSHTHTHLEQWTDTHTHTHTLGAVDRHTHTHLEQWTHTHTHTHTHLEQWTHTHS